MKDFSSDVGSLGANMDPTNGQGAAGQLVSGAGTVASNMDPTNRQGAVGKAVSNATSFAQQQYQANVGISGGGISMVAPVNLGRTAANLDPTNRQGATGKIVSGMGRVGANMDPTNRQGVAGGYVSSTVGKPLSGLSAQSVLNPNNDPFNRQGTTGQFFSTGAGRYAVDAGAAYFGGPVGILYSAGDLAGDPNTKDTAIDTYQGAAEGAATGAAAGAMFGPGAVVGAIGGAIGGGAEGFGQGVFDSNKHLFETNDPGNYYLPKWVPKPNTNVRLGYQAGLKAAAGAAVGDYFTTGVEAASLGKSAAAGAAVAVAQNNPTIVRDAAEGAVLGSTVGQPVVGFEAGAAAGIYQANRGYIDPRIRSPQLSQVVQRSKTALGRAVQSDPRRPVGNIQ